MPFPTTPRAIVEWIVSAAPTWSRAKIEGVLAAVAYVHRLAGHEPPPTAHAIVKDARQALRRAKGTAPKHVAAPITGEELSPMLAKIDRGSLSGSRDAAIILLGWWAALRRSEIVALEVSDVTPAPNGIAVRIRRSKTDQTGEGYTIGVEAKGGELCPVEALNTWFTISGITSGPIFRGLTRYGTVRRGALTDQMVARIVKGLAEGSGLDPRRFSGHSLRAGFVTEAYRQDVPEAQIMATTRHKSVSMLARYRREADPVKRGATSKMKL